jgi:hypothetical protein
MCQPVAAVLQPAESSRQDSRSNPVALHMQSRPLAPQVQSTAVHECMFVAESSIIAIAADEVSGRAAITLPAGHRTVWAMSERYKNKYQKL